MFMPFVFRHTSCYEMTLDMKDDLLVTAWHFEAHANTAGGSPRSLDLKKSRLI